MKLVLLDIPGGRGAYVERHSTIMRHLPECAGYIRIAKRWMCSEKPELVQALSVLRSRGGEGFVIRHPDAPYRVGRVDTMLKVKPEFVHP